MTDSIGTQTWGYDIVNRVTSLITPQGSGYPSANSFTYTYHRNNQPDTTTENGVGTVSTVYHYDSYRRLDQMTNQHSETTKWYYDSSGRVNKQEYASGQYEVYGYDSRSRLNSITVKENVNNTAIDSQTLTYDDVNNLLTRARGGYTTTYGYDEINQITSETRVNSSNSVVDARGYSYDHNGNRTKKVVNGTTTDYSYDNGDKLTGVNSTSLAYDSAGRPTEWLIGGVKKNLFYDYESRITSIEKKVGNFWQVEYQYRYNGLDTRVGVYNGAIPTGSTGNVRRNGVGVTAPVTQYLDSSSTTHNVTPGISDRSSSTTKYQHAGLISYDGQSGSSQTMTSTIDYDVCGGVRGTDTASKKVNTRYCGNLGHKQDDETGLIYMRARYYEPTSGRFISEDPAINGQNWYVYCANDPISCVDITGKTRETAGIAAIFGVFAAALLYEGFRSLYNQKYALGADMIRKSLMCLTISYAFACTSDPWQSGIVAMLGYFIDKLISDAWAKGVAAGSRTQAATAVTAVSLYVVIVAYFICTLIVDDLVK